MQIGQNLRQKLAIYYIVLLKNDEVEGPTFKLWNQIPTFKLSGVPGPTFKLWGRFQVPGPRVPKSQGPEVPGPGALVPLLHHGISGQDKQFQILWSLLVALAWL